MSVKRSRPEKTPQEPSDLRAAFEEVSAVLATISTKVDRIGDHVAARSDDFMTVAEIFADEVRALVGDAPPAPDAVRRAARLAVAEQAWTEQLGTLLESRDVVALLAVSKQRVSTLARDHRLIALPQGGRTRFPAWQFAVAGTSDRESLAAAHHELVETGGLSPWAAASWFQEERPELDGSDPVTFLRQGGARSRLLEIAGRDAARLAQ